MVVLTRKNYVEIGKGRERFAERAYEAATQGYLASGVVNENLQREMIHLAAQRLKPPPQLAPQRLFDFSFARKAAEGLRWQYSRPVNRIRSISRKGAKTPSSEGKLRRALWTTLFSVAAA